MLTGNIKTVTELLDLAAETYGDRTFIKFLDGDTLYEKNYTTVRSNSYAVSRYIRTFSPERMHIVIMGKTNYEYITCLTGILISGNVAVPLAPETSVEEAVDLFEKADVDMMFYENEYAENAEKIAAQYGKLKHMANLGSRSTFEEIYATYGADSEYAALSDVTIDAEACCTIMYTSGTTGVRKGVMLSTRNLMSNIMYPEFEFGENDVLLSVLPMHHIFCYSGDFLRSMRDGMTVCLNGEIAQMGKNLQFFQPSFIRLVPMIVTTLLKKVQAVERKYPQLTPRQAAEMVFGKEMHWMASTGAPLNTHLIDEYKRYDIVLRQGYGMTEAGPRVSIPSFHSDHRADACGRAITSILQVRIQQGEIQVMSPSLMMGYYKMPEQTAEMFTADGWLKTGDLGHLTEDGYVYLTGRIKNLIILSNGENVSPEEIERKYADEPLIKELVVFGENDVIVAEVFPDFQYAEAAGITDVQAALDEIVARINKTDVVFRQIDEVRIRDAAFPKTASGKIKRQRTRF